MDYSLTKQYIKELISESPILITGLPPHEEFDKMSRDMGYNLVTTEKRVKSLPAAGEYCGYTVHQLVSSDTVTDLFVKDDVTYFIFTYMVDVDRIKINLMLKFYYGDVFTFKVTDLLLDYYLASYNCIKTDNTETVRGKKMTFNLISDSLKRGCSVEAVNTETGDEVMITNTVDLDIYYGNVSTDKYQWSFTISK